MKTIMIFIIGMIVSYGIAWLAFNSGYKKGFDAGVEWERNIILEYAAPAVHCEGECPLT